MRDGPILLQSRHSKLLVSTSSVNAAQTATQSHERVDFLTSLSLSFSLSVSASLSHPPLSITEMGWPYIMPIACATVGVASA